MKILSYFFLGIACLAIIRCKAPEPERKKPNILFILADDLGYHDLSCMGSKYYETPNIDHIAETGMVFTNGYAACQVCSPSRAAIMTGKAPARIGITDWIGAKTGTAWREHDRHDKLLPAENGDHLPHTETSLAEAMKSGGYKTFFAGKWHLGGEGSYPEDHGFDINKGGWDKGSPIGGYYSPWENPKLPNQVAGESLPLRLGKETSKFITENKDSAFFAFLSFYAVHGPIQTTKEKWKKYRDKAEQQGIAESGFVMERNLPIRHEQDNPVYAGLVESMDDAVGMVLNTLRELGLEENTVVIFTSDNGGVASGDSYSTSNLPLRGGKGYQWEGGVKEPYFIKVPWLNQQGARTDVPAIGMDFYPTILELAGLEAKPLQHQDGISLLPVLEGASLPERSLYWHYPHYGNQGGDPSSMVREGDWKLIHYWEDGTNELYNLKDDPGEQSDLANSNPGQVESLRTKLENWLQETGAKQPLPDPEYNAKLNQEYRQKMVQERWPTLEAQRKAMLAPEYDPGNRWWGSEVDN
jgi:arylsulfatase A-like enzyme